MKKNMGTVDRALRAFVVAPVAIVVAFLVGAGTIAGVVLFVVAGIMLLTALTGYCPNYTIVGITTQHGVQRVPRSHLRAHHA
jgi:hypothetical protein